MSALGATMTQQDDATSQNDAAPLHPREDWTPSANQRLLKDMGISALVTLGTTLVVWSVLSGWSGAALLLLMPFTYILPFVIYIGPIAVVIYGIAKWRPGFIAGPVLLIALSVLSANIYMRLSAASARSFATKDVDRPSRDYTILALDVNEACEADCVRVLAKSSHSVAYKSGREWTLYQRSEGRICHTEELLRSTLDFLKMGFPGLCAVKTPMRDIPDALIARKQSVTGEGSAAIGLPRAFGGSVFEIIEQTGGQQRMLGRQVKGSVNLPIPQSVAVFGLWGIGSWDVAAGPHINPKTFLVSASGVPADSREKDLTPPDQLLDHIETFLDHPKISGPAISAWLTVVRANQIWTSTAFDPRITRLLNSPDPQRIALGLVAVLAKNTPNREFAQARIIALAFDPVIDLKESPVLPMLRACLNQPEPLAPALRDRAKQAFLTDDSVSQGRFQTLFQIMVRGGPDNRREAVDALFSLQGQRFEQAVEVIGRYSPDVWARSNPDRWSEQEVDRLIERLPDIPTERLDPYLSAFRFKGIMTGPQKENLLAHVRERLEVATNAPQPNETHIKLLKRLIDAIPKNMST